MPSFSKLTTAVLNLGLLVQSGFAKPVRNQAPKLGAVATESAVCSEIGIDVLKKGGNAADALVASQFCIGVIGMYHSGIGGGGFMLVRDSHGKYEFIDFRETAPAAAFQDMYNDNILASLFGGLASGVPGELRGLEYLHTNYGSLPWQELVMPAVQVARYGFKVTEDLAKNMVGKSFLIDDPNWAIDFAPNGTLLKLGDTMTRKRYAHTLETIANEGPDAFYTGAIAEATIAALTAANGTMTMEDLKNYTVAIRKTAQINYRGFKLTSTTAPSSGVVALSALNIVNGYDGFDDPAAVNLTTHRLDEAIRFAYGQRSQLGDPLFVDGLDEFQDTMTNDTVAADIRSRISDFHTLNASAYNPEGYESLPTPGTSHLVAADKSGLTVSVTTTINLIFGSLVLVPETGVIMNDEMNDFSIPNTSNVFGFIPSPFNFIRPGKRPLSSISPIIAEMPNGQLYLALGSAGGSRIITANIQNAHHVLDQNMTTAEALAQPRLHDQLSPDQVTFEYAYDNSTVAFMVSLGHNVSWTAPGESTAQALRLLPNGTFEAAGEPRQAASAGFAV
ncbi:gamma-glutamyltransferase 1 [Xylaria nigripes]|nr:gamma-glutamyltransferase 1 [Xylaria nigripes]